jgi:hypothetical protein
MILLNFSCLDALIGLRTDNFFIAIYFLVLLGITITLALNLGTLIYGIATDTTPNELFESHNNPHLWKKIEYIVHRNMLTRVYKNPNSKDFKSNLQAYWNS